jgi:putative heme transporter
VNVTSAVLQPEGAQDPGQHPAQRVVRVLVSVAIASALLAYVLPRVVGTTGREVVGAFGALSLREVTVLAVVWAAGVFTHSFVLTGALPGLTRRRALTLNLTGSAVANVLPFGGAAGMTLNYAMIRSWRVSRAGFAAFTFVTNVWVFLLKLALPAAALAVLVAVGTPVSQTLRWTALAAAGGLTVLVATLAAGLASRRTAVVAVGIVVPVLAWVGRLLGSRWETVAVASELLECRDQVAVVARRRWVQLSAGMAGYAALQALLLWACVHAVGGHLSPVQVLAGYAVDRVLTLAVLTPGAVGITEAGTAATLVALGGSPAAMAAGVLLYRGFTFALEIPVGGVWLGGWLFLRRFARRRAV